MIITEQKTVEEISKALEKHSKVFIFGCGSCATAWHTGGEPEVKEMAAKLMELGKTITGWTVSEECCDERKIKREIRGHKGAIEEADAFLVMSCGAGVRTIALVDEERPAYPALNSLYLARLERLTKSEEGCVLCGDCILDKTGGICPMTTCPKELLNGPCGGYKDGMCEVDPERPCAWILIYERLKKFNQMEKYEAIQEPKDQSRRKHPRHVDKGAAEKVAV
ncbi:MAG: methylenetetrahydrofolate reductase C-terminal domain-containing protein [Chloroflexi bacterium]|nr:methylenetetrahydrofolate reductase C-terminal domain-containing protein [Chloroflexota bacterium]